jgi:hypothetical protein
VRPFKSNRSPRPRKRGANNPDVKKPPTLRNLYTETFHTKNSHNYRFLFVQLSMRLNASCRFTMELAVLNRR